MKLIATFLIFIPLTSFAMVTSAGRCPTSFEGTVKEIIPSVGPNHAYSTKRVMFTELQDESQQHQLHLLENGPVNVEKGQEYHVEMRNGKLCRIEQI